MLRANLWNKSVSRVELDQRARDARLRLERIERLLVLRAAAKPSEIWLLIPNRNFDDPRFARFQRLSASMVDF